MLLYSIVVSCYCLMHLMPRLQAVLCVSNLATAMIEVGMRCMGVQIWCSTCSMFNFYLFLSTSAHTAACKEAQMSAL